MHTAQFSNFLAHYHQSAGENNHYHHSVHKNNNTLFCMFEDSNASKEMYNLEQDPYQLHNLIIQDDQVQNQEEESGFTTVNASWYINRLQELKNCKGHVDCNVNDVLNSIPSISSRNISNSNEEVRIYYNVEINVN